MDALKMRTRKLLYPTEKVWVDKPKYDEAERLHYEREAALAASAAGSCQELVAVNGFCHEERAEEVLKAELWRVGSGKKQKKRKLSPKAKSLGPKIDPVLAGLLADHVWFDKPRFDQAESAYHVKLADSLPLVALPIVEPAAVVPWSEDAVQAETEHVGNQAVLHCTHGSLMACHHVIQDVWVNKFHFDAAERAFVERSQLVTLAHLLQPPSVLKLASAGPVTPDEGYVTALATPSTPAHVADAERQAPTAPLIPAGDANQTVNGKPPGSSLRALLSEVWLEKPIYDDAERLFYANMFDGHPPGKVRLQERGHADISRKSRKEKKGRSSLRKQSTGKRVNNAAVGTLTPQETATAAPQPPAWHFMHPDTESLWFNKPTYDSAEACFYASLAQEEASRLSEAARAKATQPTAQPSSTPEPDAKKMATHFLMHEKIWFDKFKYDDAEKRYYEQINGPARSPSCQQLKTVLQNPQEAAGVRSKKHRGRAATASGPSPAGPAGDQNEVVTRIANLEAENQQLRSVVTNLQVAISKLECRLSVLERASASHHPSPPPPTQHVTPMKKVEPLAVQSKKVVLPSAAIKEESLGGAAAAASSEEDDDIDLFGSDEEEEDQEAARLREERLKQYAEKKSKKPGLIAKSSILLDVKPWDDETDMAKMEECVRSVQMDGLVWGASKLVPVGYGIKKLQIQCVVEDDKVGTDILEEEITKFEDYVQSVDIAAFNKI
ncbi:elongation factor 1-delta isoform X3 [Pantherophis guttatus]|uniref:Elongation factor 1-delta n=1 Tax=Pantherophis guttatus TaxID=94885 RepID=A0A6P9C8E4_PANGU|nr:elongation factor 1-delta isoform X3 [Pantherophis guttatus]